jgi:hypothetical protein
MRRGLVGSLLVLTSVTLSAQQPGATLAQPALQPLAFLVGSCWSGTQPKGTVDTHCFSPVYGGYYIRDVHEVTGAAKPYAGESLYHWDATQKQVRFTYYNSIGGVSMGTMQAEEGRLVFPESYESKDGKRIEMRSVWTREGADTFVAKTDVKTGESWKEQFRVVFKRRTDLRPPAEPVIR